jgi:hypothetical protein
VLRKTTCVEPKVEYAFVSVPVRKQLWDQHPDDPKKQRVNGDKIFEIAMSMGKDASILWAPECAL